MFRVIYMQSSCRWGFVVLFFCIWDPFPFLSCLFSLSSKTLYCIKYGLFCQQLAGSGGRQFAFDPSSDSITTINYQQKSLIKNSNIQSEVAQKIATKLEYIGQNRPSEQIWQGDNFIIYMDKYRVFDKIIKTKVCTYFKAQQEVSRKSVMVKKLNKVTTWQQILKDRDLATMKNSKLKNFPSVHEIIKSEDQFYIIMESMHKNLEFVIKADIEKQVIFRIGRLLVQLAANFAEKKIYPREIRPAHLFLDQAMTILKLGHLETNVKDISRLDLVELQDLRYLSPEQVLTSKQIDERSLVFNIGLIICDLIQGKSLITANTKMQYIFEMTRLFPEEQLGNVEGSEHNVKSSPVKDGDDNFDKIIRKFNFSNQFIALLKQMLKIDKTERLNVLQLLDAWDVVVENEKNYEKNLQIANQQAQIENKPNAVQYPINDEIDLQLEFDFEQKPTLSTLPTIKITAAPLPSEKNVDDDVSQPIIIKKSKNEFNNKLNSTKDSINKSLNTKPQPSLSTIRKPQLTNYALNEANLGVQMGMNPSIFSENDI